MGLGTIILVSCDSVLRPNTREGWQWGTLDLKIQIYQGNCCGNSSRAALPSDVVVCDRGFTRNPLTGGSPKSHQIYGHATNHITCLDCLPSLKGVVLNNTSAFFFFVIDGNLNTVG